MMRHVTNVELLALAAALPIGLAIGLLDIRSEEVQGTVLLLLIVGAALAFMAPRWALGSGILLGLGVPLVHAYVRLAHVTLPYAVNGYWSTFLAIVPAVLAAGAGGLAARALRR